MDSYRMTGVSEMALARQVGNALEEAIRGARRGCAKTRTRLT